MINIFLKRTFHFFPPAHTNSQIMNLLRTPSTSSGATLDNERINIEFLTWPIIRYKREVLFGWVDLLVSFGGIAGLFLGFSLLSGIEIIYYFTVRAGCMMYKNRVSFYVTIYRKLDFIKFSFLTRHHVYNILPTILLSPSYVYFYIERTLRDSTRGRFTTPHKI